MTVEHLFGEQDRILRDVSGRLLAAVLNQDAAFATLRVVYGEPAGPNVEYALAGCAGPIPREAGADVLELLASLDGHRGTQGIEWTGFHMQVAADGNVEIDFEYGRR